MVAGRLEKLGRTPQVTIANWLSYHRRCCEYVNNTTPAHSILDATNATRNLLPESKTQAIAFILDKLRLAGFPPKLHAAGLPRHNITARLAPPRRVLRHGTYAKQLVPASSQNKCASFKSKQQNTRALGGNETPDSITGLVRRELLSHPIT